MNFEYLIFKSFANLKSEATRTYLSLLWWLLEPSLLLVIYYFVFAVILDRFTADFVPFLLIGLIGWQFFANTVSNASSSISSQWGLMQRVYVHKLTMPIVSVLTDTYKYAIVLAVLSFFLLAYGFEATRNIWFLPFVVIPHIILTAGIAVFLGAIVPMLPDLRILIANFMRVGLYISGVLYPASSVPEKIQPYFYWNPMVGVLESYRNVFMYNTEILWSELVYAACVGLFFFILGSVIVFRLDRQYPRLTVR